MIGGYLMTDLSRNRVHLRWLLKLVDFRALGEFSWGSVVLATLYREMCRATRPNKAKIGGTILLSIFTSSSEPPIYIPTDNENHLASYVGIPTSLEDIRLLLDQLSEAQDLWQAIFTIGRGEAKTNSCPKGTTGPLNSRRRDDDPGSSKAPTQSPDPSTMPTQSPGPTL
ncbi:hypothetical protein CXB51_014681 [Gossypium anomalum]|uniref:Aminotransferase-like plant mobile domain-containing protein n=1 Tax=Gossypium anomalum TaxID=47600 RepID=A0A8J6D2V0_9ROSI|nr:hypothetical protein CXB51_014681 [Gossypium anomalum]